jgi:hypothetical protein
VSTNWGAGWAATVARIERGQTLPVRDIDPALLAECYTASLAAMDNGPAAGRALAHAFYYWWQNSVILVSQPPKGTPDASLGSREHRLLVWVDSDVTVADSISDVVIPPYARLNHDAQLRGAGQFVVALKDRWAEPSTKTAWRARMNSDVQNAWGLGREIG